MKYEGESKIKSYLINNNREKKYDEKKSPKKSKKKKSKFRLNFFLYTFPSHSEI